MDGAVQFHPAVGPAEEPGLPARPALVRACDRRSRRSCSTSSAKVASLARPIATNADVPAERVAALRRAFDATMADAEFLAEAQKQGMEISPMPGEERGSSSRHRQRPGADLELVQAGGEVGTAALLARLPHARETRCSLPPRGEAGRDDLSARIGGRAGVSHGTTASG